MPQVVKANPSGKTEEQVKLGTLKPGDIFRHPWNTFEQALTGEEGAGFFMIIETVPKKTGRVTILTIDGKSVQERDDDHLVVLHPSKLEIGEAKMV